jgi:hypothetical protein
MTEAATHPHAEQRRAWARPFLFLALAVVYAALAFASLGPTLTGSFVSDDALIIVGNPYIQELSAENLVEIIDPDGPGVLFSMNYAPVHITLHALERAVFGDTMLGYHVVNLVLHVGVALLLAMLLAASRVPLALAAAAGAVFVAHPANAEAVAMAFQAKTLLSTLFAFGAILVFWRHPAASVALFALALLTKIAAAFALPMVAVMAWTRAPDPQRPVPHWSWLLGWLGVLLLVAVPEFAAFERIGQHAVGLGDGVRERALTIVSFAARYLAMALTGYGVSSSHSLDAVRTFSDAWFLAGTVALALLAWRAVNVLLRRQEEAAWWISAVAAFAPISQVFPFQYPMADRYLYDILPGLIGGVLLACTVTPGRPRSWFAAIAAGGAGPRLRLVPVAVLVLVALVFSVTTRARSGVFRADRLMMAEAAQNYPDGLDAWLLEFEDAAHAGDAARTRAALRALNERGYNSFHALTPVMPVGLNDDPEIVAIVRRMAEARIPHYEGMEELHQVELNLLAQAYLAAGRAEAALATAERAVERGGPHDQTARTIQREARLAVYREERGAGAGPTGTE